MNPIIVKYGGSLLDDRAQQSQLLEQVALAAKAHVSLIVVHGGGKEISRQMEQAGVTPRFVNGRRFTDESTMAVVEKALAKLNGEIVAKLGEYNIPVRGLSGRTQHLMEAKPISDLGRVGLPTQVDSAVLSALLKLQGLPVFYSVAEDAGRNPLNINADDFSLELAIACGAEDLIFLTDTGGILDSENRLIPRLTPTEVDGLIEKGTIHGGMVVKARSCIDAMRRGVRQVRIGKMVRYIDGQLQVDNGTAFSLSA